MRLQDLTYICSQQKDFTITMIANSKYRRQIRFYLQKLIKIILFNPLKQKEKSKLMVIAQKVIFK
jgi:hypothetical protein